MSLRAFLFQKFLTSFVSQLLFCQIADKFFRQFLKCLSN